VSELPVEVRFVLQTLNFVDKLVPDFVVNMQRFKLLADLQLQEVVCFFDLKDVHLLQL
jgi:hypothetical protein